MMDDADFFRMIELERANAVEMLDALPEPQKDCGNTEDCEDCDEAHDCTLKWEYGYECDADCRNCNNDDCRDR
jgi:hypothetical protein